jgi:ubiquinone biosynthesis protein Coq4
MSERADFQKMVCKPDLAALAHAVRLAKQGRGEGRLQMAAAMAWVAFACPEATNAVYDALAVAWLGTGTSSAFPAELPEAPPEDSFWQAFWAVVDGAKQGYNATTITVAVAALSGAVHPGMEHILEKSAHHHPGATAALTQPVPGHTDLMALASCPEDSLGHDLYRMIVDNGYDLEVLDREEIMLSQLPPALCYLNTRILQMHDVWHLVAGYETTGTHEIAISAFQLAQFGHNYSAMFLATGAMIGHIEQPRGFSILMQIILEAWQHGRNTPAFMDIHWEDQWDKPVSVIRREYGITAYRGVFQSDLLEIASEASFWRRLGLGLKLMTASRRLRKGKYLLAA